VTFFGGAWQRGGWQWRGAGGVIGTAVTRAVDWYHCHRATATLDCVVAAFATTRVFLKKNFFWISVLTLPTPATLPPPATATCITHQTNRLAHARRLVPLPPRHCHSLLCCGCLCNHCHFFFTKISEFHAVPLNPRHTATPCHYHSVPHTKRTASLPRVECHHYQPATATLGCVVAVFATTATIFNKIFRISMLSIPTPATLPPLPLPPCITHQTNRLAPARRMPPLSTRHCHSLLCCCCLCNHCHFFNKIFRISMLSL
jgi:hypothetical protein